MNKRAKYRPAAPIDGCGNITLSDEVLADRQQLGKEAAHYATDFINEGYRFWIGVSDFSTNRALVYTIESARNLCGGLGSIDTAIRLLEMALAEAKQAKGDYEGERRTNPPNPSIMEIKAVYHLQRSNRSLTQ